MTSRWTQDNAAAAEADALRKQEREEKRRRKEEKARKALLSQIQPSIATSKGFASSSIEPSNKRQRTEGTEEKEEAQEEGTSLLSFTSKPISSSGSLNDFDVLNNIEEGSYGFVSRARLKSTGEVFALKKLKLEQTNEGFPVTGLREIQTLRACSHDHIVRLDEVVTDHSFTNVYLVMEFVEHDLKTLLEDMSQPFLQSETKTILMQVCSAVDYLHKNWILHRDLKTSNILMNNKGEIKIADFGMARYTAIPPPRLTQLVVTLWYRAPELLLGTEDYGFEIDVWSIGCIFGELLTRHPVFQGRNEVSHLSEIFKLVGMPTHKSWPGFRTLPNAKALLPLLDTYKASTSNISTTKFPGVSESGLELLSDMLALNPDHRPTPAEVLKYQYFLENPRPTAKEIFPTFPSKAGQEKRRRRMTPRAPVRGAAPKLEIDDFANSFAGSESVS